MGFFSGATGAALISAGGGLIGGLMANRANRKINRGMLEFERNKIQTTVADARKAGLHPLFALGAGVSHNAPQQIGDSMGDAVRASTAEIANNIVRSEENRRAEKLADAQIYESKARAANQLAQARESKIAGDQVMRSMANSLNARVKQNSNSQQDQLKLPNESRWLTGDSAKQEDIEGHYGGIVGEGYGLWRALVDAFDQPSEEKPRAHKGSGPRQRGNPRGNR